ncbi:TVP38/TMEM64 family protein [Saccharopolyspora rhizosphaerae]|uniref:TVP38/TMEM64 family membrane protein n=1 Tax=Saccharopolyspora rhizosphaerae TaxID=2492662 RepID=A0A3R8QZP2_9PSEU|nr:VTT domain-containing protein [Saccharopolyspora rhizosphaerae]RRO14692.1 TVP38/TMEM64 family protein [Saccharopolyspora rhizosphaerae]
MSPIRKADMARSASLRLALLGIGLAVALAVGAWSGPDAPLLDVQTWHEASSGWTPLLFVLAFGAAALVFAPRPALSTIAGIVFTMPVAVPVVVAGTVLGAGLAFGIARLLGREALAPLLRNGRLHALDSAFARRGFTATVICRLLPIVPYGVVNYGAGVTRVRPLPFLAGTAVGTLPANLAYITAGNALAAGAGWMPTLCSGLAAAALLGIGWLARRLARTRPAPGAADVVSIPAATPPQ